MKLVEIGRVTINFDQVNYVRDPSAEGGSGAITVVFASGATLEILTHANTLMTWLGANLYDPASPPSGI